MNIGLLGGGSIAQAVAAAVGAGQLPGITVVGVVGSGDPPSPRVAATAAAAHSRVCDLDSLLKQDPAWILEAAGATAVRTHLESLVASQANVIVMSIGALLDASLWKLVEQKRGAGGEVILPSGAIGGLDVVTALNALGDLESVTLTTTKAPAGLQGAPYLTEHDVRLPGNSRLVVFDGSAAEAVRGFPANVNVAAAVSLAGIGPERTRVRIVSDPAAVRTRHEIEASGRSGRMALQVESEPSPANPKSSYLAALSAIATLRGVQRGVPR